MSAITNGANFTIECQLSSHSAENGDPLQKFVSTLPKDATAKLNLTLFNGTGILKFQDKILEIGKNSLSLKETVRDFDLVRWSLPNQEVSGTVIVTLCIGNAAIQKGMHALELCTKILNNMEHADVEIVASDGTKIPCHKAFLTAQSAFFQRMFASGMKEAIHGSVSLDDISANGVQAMLKFIYYGDLEEALANCETALELLIAGDQYEVQNLENCMQNLLMNKAPEWFSTSMALELWQFANKKTRNENNETYKQLEEKAVAALKTKPENEIRECTAFSKLLENPQGGIVEFCFYLLKNVGEASAEQKTPDAGEQQAGNNPERERNDGLFGDSVHYSHSTHYRTQLPQNINYSLSNNQLQALMYHHRHMPN